MVAVVALVRGARAVARRAVDVAEDAGVGRAEGVTDFAKYAAVPGTPDSELFPDIFLD